MRKNYLSRSELAKATQNHECVVCGKGFVSGCVSDEELAVVLPGSRELVHKQCWKFPEHFHVRDVNINYSQHYGLPTGHRAWSVLNRVANTFDVKEYSLNAIEDAVDDFRKRRNSQ